MWSKCYEMKFFDYLLSIVQGAGSFRWPVNKTISSSCFVGGRRVITLKSWHEMHVTEHSKHLTVNTNTISQYHELSYHKWCFDDEENRNGDREENIIDVTFCECVFKWWHAAKDWKGFQEVPYLSTNIVALTLPWKGNIQGMFKAECQKGCISKRLLILFL